MSQVQKLATQLAWADRKENGRREIARDRWCITALLRAGDIVASQHGAAVRLSSLMERSQGQGASGSMEAVDGGANNIHARMMDKALCAREAECAMASVRTRLAGPQADKRISVLDAALSFPHRSVSEAARDAGIGYGNKRDFLAHLRPGLDLLVVYFDSVDAQQEREDRR